MGLAVLALVLVAHPWGGGGDSPATAPPGGALWAAPERNVTCRAHQWRVSIFDDFHFRDQVDSDCYDYNPLDPCGAVADITDCWCPPTLTSCGRFSATFAATVDVVAERLHVFLINANDEAHMFIDGRASLSVLCSGASSCRDRAFVRDLTPGRHDLNVRYMNHDHGAHLFLRWQPIVAEDVDFNSGPVMRQGQLSGGGTANAFAFQADAGVTYHVSLQAAELTSVRLLLFDDAWTEVSSANMEGDENTGHLVWSCATAGKYRLVAIPGPRSPAYAVAFLLSIAPERDACTQTGLTLAAPAGVLDFSTSDAAANCVWQIQCRQGFAASIMLTQGNPRVTAYAGAVVSAPAAIANTAKNVSTGTLLTSSNNNMLLQYSAASAGASGFVGEYRCVEEQFVEVEVGGVSMEKNIVSAGDRGAFRFLATGGQMYGIQIQRESLPRCVLQLMHADGETVLVMLDDRGERQASVEWLCPADGEYSFTVVPYQEDHMGSFRVMVFALTDACGGRAVELTSATGVLVFSNRYTSAPVSCAWTLHCQSSEMANIFFTGFHTSRRGILQVYDGPDALSEPITSLTGPLGASGAGSFDSEGSAMHVVYTSESLAREQFELEYRCDSPVFRIDDCANGQFLVSYYANTQFSGDSAQAVCSEPLIDFNWGQGGVDMLGGQVDNFAIRWSGSLEFAPGNYVFFSRSDDGSRLLVDNAVVLDHLQDCCATWHSEGIGLLAGQHDIVYEFVEYGAEAYCTLTWMQTSRIADEGCSPGLCKNAGQCMEVAIPETSYPAVMTAFTIEVTQNFSEAILDRTNPTRKSLEDYVTRAYADIMEVPVVDVIVMSIREQPELADPNQVGWVHHPGGVPITIQFSVLCTPQCPNVLGTNTLPTTMMAMPAHTAASCNCASGFSGSRCGVQACDGQTLTLDMRDLEGDGWNGNTLEVRSRDGSVVVRGVTLGGGTVASTQLCLPTGTCLHVTVDGGTSREEVSWDLYDAAGTSLLSGGAPFSGQMGC